MKKIQNNLEKLVRVFYDDFFRKNPEIKSIFRNSQLEKQQIELKNGLELIFNIKDDTKKLDRFLEDLGIRHVTYEVTAKHYVDVKESLTYAFKQTYQDDYNSKLEKETSDLIDYICSKMLTGAKKVSSRSRE